MKVRIVRAPSPSVRGAMPTSVGVAYRRHRLPGRHRPPSWVLSVRLSVRHAFESALYLLNPWWDLQITLHKCQVWWDDVQCLSLTKVRSRSHSKIKHCMTVFHVRSISFEPLVGFTNNFPKMLALMRQCAVPMCDQGRFKVKVKN